MPHFHCWSMCNHLLIFVVKQLNKAIERKRLNLANRASEEISRLRELKSSLKQKEDSKKNCHGKMELIIWYVYMSFRLSPSKMPSHCTFNTLCLHFKAGEQFTSISKFGFWMILSPSSDKLYFKLIVRWRRCL